MVDTRITMVDVGVGNTNGHLANQEATLNPTKDTSECAKPHKIDQHHQCTVEYINDFFAVIRFDVPENVSLFKTSGCTLKLINNTAIIDVQYLEYLSSYDFNFNLSGLFVQGQNCTLKRQLNKKFHTVGNVLVCTANIYMTSARIAKFLQVDTETRELVKLLRAKLVTIADCPAHVIAKVSQCHASTIVDLINPELCADITSAAANQAKLHSHHGRLLLDLPDRVGAICTNISPSLKKEWATLGVVPITKVPDIKPPCKELTPAVVNVEVNQDLLEVSDKLIRKMGLQTTLVALNSLYNTGKVEVREYSVYGVVQ